MTKRWDYGKSGDHYPVKAGDIWKVGPHVLACGDLEDGAAQRLLKWHGTMPDMTYVDPPWTPSLLTGFRTKADQPRGIPFLDFLAVLAGAVTSTKGDIYMEMGLQHADHLKEAMQAYGRIETGRWPITYYKKNPALLMRYREGPDLESIGSFTGMDDEDTPRIAITLGSSVDGLIFDPCTGRGLTARSVHRLGRRFIGLELHPRRLAVAIDSLVLMDAGEPKRIDSL